MDALQLTYEGTASSETFSARARRMEVGCSLIAKAIAPNSVAGRSKSGGDGSDGRGMSVLRVSSIYRPASEDAWASRTHTRLAP